jgi:DNA (cytosine-5)-methyltransferase 1
MESSDDKRCQSGDKRCQSGDKRCESKKWKMIDLFAGTGAFSIAFQETGQVEVVFANDLMDASKKIYDANFQHKLTLKDLNDIPVEEIPSHDILTGGFPCQPFSVAGRQEGFDDQRANVFWKILEILDMHRPKCIVLENVKNLVGHDDGNTFRIICTELRKRGYTICHKVLNTANLTGIPQHRERIYIVGWLEEHPLEDFLDFPDVPKKPIQDFLENADTVPDKYYYKEGSTCWTLLEPAVKKMDTVYQYRRVYVRENKSKECPTLTANMGGGGHNVPIVLDKRGIRKFTPRECFRFQGFPYTYQHPPKMSDTALYKLAGNAVSLPVVRLIANKMVHRMNSRCI